MAAFRSEFCLTVFPNPQRPHTSSRHTPPKRLAKQRWPWANTGATLPLGRRRMHLTMCLPESWVRQCRGSSECQRAKVKSSQRGCIFLLQVFYIYSQIQLSKALDYPGDISSLRGCGDWEVGREGKFNFKIAPLHLRTRDLIRSDLNKICGVE